MIEIGPVRFNWSFVLILLLCLVPLVRDGNWYPVAILAGFIGLGLAHAVWREKGKERPAALTVAADGECRCGSHTHPGFVCNRCGGVA